MEPEIWPSPWEEYLVPPLWEDIYTTSMLVNVEPVKKAEDNDSKKPDGFSQTDPADYAIHDPADQEPDSSSSQPDTATDDAE